MRSIWRRISHGLQFRQQVYNAISGLHNIVTVNYPPRISDSRNRKTKSDTLKSDTLYRYVRVGKNLALYVCKSVLIARKNRPFERLFLSADKCIGSHVFFRLYVHRHLTGYRWFQACPRCPLVFSLLPSYVFLAGSAEPLVTRHALCNVLNYLH